MFEIIWNKFLLRKLINHKIKINDVYILNLFKKN